MLHVAAELKLHGKFGLMVQNRAQLFVRYKYTGFLYEWICSSTVLQPEFPVKLQFALFRKYVHVSDICSYGNGRVFTMGTVDASVKI